MPRATSLDDVVRMQILGSFDEAASLFLDSLADQAQRRYAVALGEYRQLCDLLDLHLDHALALCPVTGLAWQHPDYNSGDTCVGCGLVAVLDLDQLRVLNQRRLVAFRRLLAVAADGGAQLHGFVRAVFSCRGCLDGRAGHELPARPREGSHEA